MEKTQQFRNRFYLQQMPTNTDLSMCTLYKITIFQYIVTRRWKKKIARVKYSRVYVFENRTKQYNNTLPAERESPASFRRGISRMRVRTTCVYDA